MRLRIEQFSWVLNRSKPKGYCFILFHTAPKTDSALRHSITVILNPSFLPTWPSTLLGLSRHSQFYLLRSSQLHVYLFLFCSPVIWKALGCESVLLKLSYMGEVLKILKHTFWFRSLGWGLKLCISDKFPGKAHAICAGITL